jgi:hypothetical protein
VEGGGGGAGPDANDSHLGLRMLAWFLLGKNHAMLS